LIKSVDGQKISSADDLLSAIESKQPGERVQVVIIRGGVERAVEVTLGRPE
jgi:S1-C subfamily serine protease